MKPNDFKKAITAEDIIRMYNLNNLKTDRKIITNIRNTLNRQHTIIKEFIMYTTPYKSQADILTAWFYNGVPTLENNPFIQFNEENKELHVGDLYYDRDEGKTYRLFKEEEYNWVIIDDYNLLKSMALANSEADTSDNKRKIFYNIPTTPYEIGDIWLDGNYIMRCRCARTKGDYNNADWIVQEDYSNELVLGETRAVLDEFKITIEKDYVTKVQLETSKDSILASVEAVTTEIVTTATQKYEFYDTELAQLKIDVGSITTEVSEVKTNFGEEVKNLNSKIEQTAGTITQTITDNVNNLSSRIEQNESSISSKVNKDQFGSYMQQYYDKFLIGFNDASNYIQIDINGISIYEGNISNSYLLMKLSRYGQQFYKDGKQVGLIGTNNYSGDNSQKGLVFDLDYQGSYMGWFQRTNSSDSYTAILNYTRSGSFGGREEGIHVWTNMYGHNYNLYNFNVSNLKTANYEAVKNESIPVITDIGIDEEGNLTWTKSSINVRNGIVTAVPQNSLSLKE